MSLVPVPAEPSEQTAGASCPNCAAPLASDQRYCLSCGQPTSPVRLAFLDVLQAERPRYGNDGYGSIFSQPDGAAGVIPPGYAPVIEPIIGAPGPLRRYAGLLGLLSVLLLAIVTGLLVGHWVTQNKSPGQQVLKVEGLTAAAPAAAATPTSTPATTTPTTSAPAASSQTSKTGKSGAKTEAEEVTEAKALEHVAPPTPVKAAAPKIKKLSATTGKKHEEEVNSLGAQPIETGG